jgi:hypothetical protein
MHIARVETGQLLFAGSERRLFAGTGKNRFKGNKLN